MHTPSQRQQDAIAAGPPPSPAPPRKRRRWWLLGAMGALLVGAVALAVFQFVLKDEPYENPERLAKLEKAALTQPAPAATTDWPQWRGPNRNGISGETGLLTTWPDEGPTLLWEKRAGKGYSSPVVASGRVYLFMQDKNDEAVACFSLDDGKELWRFRYPAQYKNSYGDGPRSTPTIDGDRIYTVGGTGVMHCLKTHPKTSDGEVVWRKDLFKDFGAKNLDWGLSFSPLVANDLVYVNPGGPDDNSVAALDKHTGDIRWRALDDTAGYSSPMLAKLAGRPQVVFFTAKGLVGLEPGRGELLWRFGWETYADCNIATPIIAGDYVFISTGYNRGCAVVEIEADRGGNVSAHRVYENHAMHNHFSSSVFHEDHIYGFDEAELRCVNFRTGQVVWKHRERDLGKGSLLIADGYLLILGEQGKVALAEATAAGYREKASFRASDSRCWVAPVLSNGRLFIREQQKLMCFDLRKP
jgi:outer membrane protein assembly factor BamB